MIKKKYIGIDVVQAAKSRIIQAFAKGRRVWLSFSGGKDSIVLADIVVKLIEAEQIDKQLLTVTFIDEEAMYDDVIAIVKQWRMKFSELGVAFEWYCLPVKHYNCLNSLSDEETFICWDPAKKYKWVRAMPKYAIKDDEYLIPYKDNYQSFMNRKTAAYNAISLRGVRVAESVQRLKTAASRKTGGTCCPIYDMTDKDVWLYIKKHGLDIPATYENMYRVGIQPRRLRISQFFSIDTATSLVNMAEMYPGLMQRVVRREPNAYLCTLYWDSEMFGRSTRKRKSAEGADTKDYRAETYKLLKKNDSEGKRIEEIKAVKRLLIIKNGSAATTYDNRFWKEAYNILLVGDPKGRKHRALMQDLMKSLSHQKEDTSEKST